MVINILTIVSQSQILNYLKILKNDIFKIPFFEIRVSIFLS